MTGSSTKAEASRAAFWLAILVPKFRIALEQLTRHQIQIIQNNNPPSSSNKCRRCMAALGILRFSTEFDEPKFTRCVRYNRLRRTQRKSSKIRTLRTSTLQPSSQTPSLDSYESGRFASEPAPRIHPLINAFPRAHGHKIFLHQAAGFALENAPTTTRES